MSLLAGKRVLLLALTAAVLLMGVSARRRPGCHWRCGPFVRYFQNKCPSFGTFSSYLGHSHRHIATKAEMYHMPRGDASHEACRTECARNPVCTGYEYVLTPSHPGSLAVKSSITQSMATGTQVLQSGGRYLGENSTSYIGHDCMKRCVGICSREIFTRWDDPNFITDDPHCTFYRKMHCEFPPHYAYILNYCLSCMPHITTTTPAPPTTPNNPGCPGDDFLNTEVISVTGLPASDIIPGAPDVETCKQNCLNMAFTVCPGFFFDGTTCYRYSQEPNLAGVTVDCDPATAGSSLLYRRLEPETCVLPEVTPTTNGPWGVFADTALPAGFGFPGLPIGVSALCCTTACNYDPTCCAVDYNAAFGACIRHNVAGNSIPFSCNVIQTAPGDVTHYAKPLGPNPCTARYTEDPGADCTLITPPQ